MVFFPAVAAAERVVPIVSGERPPLFAYGSWEKPVMAQDAGPIALRGVDGRGGYGYNFHDAGPLDLSRDADLGPALTVEVGPDNAAETLRVMLVDGDGTQGVWRMDVPDQPGPHMLRPSDGAPLSDPPSLETEGTEPGLDLAEIRQVQVLGDWMPAELDVRVMNVLAAVPDAQAWRRMQEEREREAAAREAEARRALEALTRGEAAPSVEHVAALAPDLLQLTIQAGRIPAVKLVPYSPQPGDEVRPNDSEVVAWPEGQGKGELAVVGEHLSLYRDGKQIGFVSGDRSQMLPVETVVGDPLDERLVDRPQGYAIRSSDDAAYSSPTPPVEVYRKSKPTNHTHPAREAAMVHRVILKLPEPMTEGATYAIELGGVNTRQETVEYVHDPRNTRSDAVHASQVGYRPDDPFKVAHLSTWLGTGGGLAYDVGSFELIDQGGETVFTGTVEEVKGVGEAELLKEEKDYAKTAVYALDFGDFDGTGTFRVFVPGVGTSGPIPIGDDVWTDAFKTSMKGLLHHRSGIALGAPFTDYERPRPHHPDDGFEVFEFDIPLQVAQSAEVNAAAKKILKSGNLPPTRDSAWGGYMDAGDYDRRSQHLEVTYLLLELFGLFPDFYEGMALALPPEEADNGLPDVLDEALFNLAFYRRLQRDDGGVGGGVEASSHPREAETSWTESLFLGTFAPDSYTSHHFAANAAKFARLAGSYDATLAAEYREAATKAFDWAEAHLGDFRPDGGQATNVAEVRQLAAVELLGLTGEAQYDEIFRSLTSLADGDGEAGEAAAFAYARLPEGVGDPAVKEKAKRHVVALADAAVGFAQGNAFGISTPYEGLPVIGFVGYFSAPGIVSRALPRAHHLTGDETYLAGAIRSANFAAGGQPRQPELHDRRRLERPEEPPAFGPPPHRPARPGRDHRLRPDRPRPTGSRPTSGCTPGSCRGR